MLLSQSNAKRINITVLEIEDSIFIVLLIDGRVIPQIIFPIYSVLSVELKRIYTLIS